MVMVLFLLIYIFTSVLTFCVYADGRVVDGDDAVGQATLQQVGQVRQSVHVHWLAQVYQKTNNYATWTETNKHKQALLL